MNHSADTATKAAARAQKAAMLLARLARQEPSPGNTAGAADAADEALAAATVAQMAEELAVKRHDTPLAEIKAQAELAEYADIAVSHADKAEKMARNAQGAQHQRGTQGATGMLRTYPSPPPRSPAHHAAMPPSAAMPQMVRGRSAITIAGRTLAWELRAPLDFTVVHVREVSDSTSPAAAGATRQSLSLALTAQMKELRNRIVADAMANVAPLAPDRHQRQRDALARAQGPVSANVTLNFPGGVMYTLAKPAGDEWTVARAAEGSRARIEGTWPSEHDALTRVHADYRSVMQAQKLWS